MKIVFAAAVLLLCLVVPSYSQELRRAERPEVKLNDTWAFRETDVLTGEKRPIKTRTVSEVGPNKIVVTTEDGSRIYTREWNLVEVKTGRAITSAAKPFWPNLKFPLEVGKKWEQQYESMTRSGERKYEGRATLEVVGIETVHVPAGGFEAFKIRQRREYQGSGTFGSNWGGLLELTVWYAPAARNLVRMEWEDRSGSFYSHEVRELMSLQLDREQASSTHAMAPTTASCMVPTGSFSGQFGGPSRRARGETAPVELKIVSVAPPEVEIKIPDISRCPGHFKSVSGRGVCEGNQMKLLIDRSSASTQDCKVPAGLHLRFESGRLMGRLGGRAIKRGQDNLRF